MILVLALMFAAALTVGYRVELRTQAQRLALYLIITGSAAGMVAIASTWHYLG